MKGWRNRNHTQSQLNDIELYLNTGDPMYLPAMYKAIHRHYTGRL